MYQSPLQRDHADTRSAEAGLFRLGRRRFLLCLLIAIAGVVVSLSLARLHWRQESQFAEICFKHDAQRRIEAIQQAAVDRLNLIAILEAFYAGSELVERGEFHTFADSLLPRFQGVRMLGWAPLVSGGQRRAFEKAVREDGFPQYEIIERGRRGQFVSAGERDEYCPILFVEPFGKRESLLGFDLRSDPACRHATTRAMDTGRPAVAACTPPGKDATNEKMLYVVAPIPATAGVPPSAADHSHIAGFVFGVFNIRLVVEQALRSFPPVGIEIYIREHLPSGEGDSVYYRPSPVRAIEGMAEPAPPRAKSSAAGISARDYIKAVDRVGVIECVPLESYMKRYRSWGPFVSLGSGLLISGLLVGLVYVLTGRTARVRRLVTQRTQELRASEQRYRRLVENAGEIIVLHDSKGNIVDVNKLACETSGYTRDELLAMNVSDIDQGVSSGEHLRFWNLGDDRYPVTFEGTHVRKDGGTFPVEVRLVPIYLGNRRLMLGMARDITDRKRAEEELRNEQRLLREMLDLQEQERRLISYEIHDGLAQQLAGTTMKFQAVERLREGDPQAAQKNFDEALRMLDDALAETRRLIYGLRPPVLDQSGIEAAVEVLISGYRRQGGPEIEFLHALESRRFVPPLESAVFRIVQESLTNAFQHGGSDKVSVELGVSEDRLVIDVRDWGVGFDPHGVKAGHFGLRGIRERARLLGGSTEIHSAPGEGTHVHVELPSILPVENGATPNNHRREG